MTPPILWGDLETYSPVPIAHGVHAYAEHAQMLLFAYALNDGPVKVWDCTATAAMPGELSAALHDPQTLLYFHNAPFDRTVLRHGGHDIPVTRWRDAMVQALAHALPGSLSTLCEIFRLPVDRAKDNTGRRLISLFCKPRPASCTSRRATRATHPQEWAQFVDYARRDVDAMREVVKRLPSHNYPGMELDLWSLDQTINDRGILVDTALAHAAIRAVERAKQALARRTSVLTSGQVQAATQRDALQHHLRHAHGVALPDMQQGTLARRMEDPALPEEVRELLSVRLQASATSTAKYTALVNGTSRDGRLRGTLQFNGASRTGRWAGRLFQPQNLPRPTLDQAMIEHGIAAMKANCEDLLFDHVMALTSSALRSCLIAPPHKKLVVADLSSIEGRVLAWLAGEASKLHAFRDFDTCRGVDGHWHSGASLTRAALTGQAIALHHDAHGAPVRQGHDLYKRAYARSFGLSPETVTKEQRQIGKVRELAPGYGGGVGAFAAFATLYRIDLEAMAEQAAPTVPPSLLQEAVRALEWTQQTQRPTFGLSDRAWLVCDVFKRAWRQAHPAIVSFWSDVQAAAVRAITDPGTVYRCRALKLHHAHGWLRICLPSGRLLCYPAPKVEQEGALSYMGTRQWTRIHTYGGKLVENITQAVSRDVLAACMPAIEAAGYPIVLTVHDEIITETDDHAAFNAAYLAALMATPPAWGEDLPLAAEGFETHRYRKG